MFGPFIHISLSSFEKDGCLPSAAQELLVYKVFFWREHSSCIPLVQLILEPCLCRIWQFSTISLSSVLAKGDAEVF